MTKKYQRVYKSHKLLLDSAGGREIGMRSKAGGEETHGGLPLTWIITIFPLFCFLNQVCPDTDARMSYAFP